jgi:hypothetical protein
VVQLYVYLCRYNDKPLDQKAFDQLEQMLTLCRDNGMRVLLRFAYQNESIPDPDYIRVRGHLEQIEEWFKAHQELLEESLCAMQAGIVGFWGEGHSNKNTKNFTIGWIFDKVFHMTPADIFVQVRNIDLMNKVSSKYQDRMGMHDDYLIGDVNGPWSFFNGQAKTGYEERFARTLNDAEMPWGIAKYYDREDGAPLNALDARSILAQVKQYSLSTLSLEHNYREDNGPASPYSMARWKNEFLSPAELAELGLPYLPSLFAEAAQPSVYDYIRYHLGYLLSIPSFAVTENSIRFTIQNNGFAAPLNANALSLVVDGVEYLVGSYDKYALGSMKAVSYTVDLPAGFDPAAPHDIGVKLARHAGSDICLRFANTTPFAEGAQWMLGGPAQ